MEQIPRNRLLENGAYLVEVEELEAAPPEVQASVIAELAATSSQGVHDFVLRNRKLRRSEAAAVKDDEPVEDDEKSKSKAK